MAQNPQVLAQLLRDNPRADPRAYTTPASVFNTLAVDFAQAPAPAADPPLHTRPIPVTQLHRLDPLAPSPSPTPATHAGRVAVQESCDNLCAPPDPPVPDAPVPVPVSEAYPSRVRSLERTPRVAERGPSRVGSLERARPTPTIARQHSVPASPPRRDRDVGQFAVQGALNAHLAASVMNKMRQQPEPPLVEEIYDFGGDNVKSCVAVSQRAGLGAWGVARARPASPQRAHAHAPHVRPQCATRHDCAPVLAHDTQVTRA